MCLPFICGDHDDHGSPAHAATQRQKPTTACALSDQEDGQLHYKPAVPSPVIKPHHGYVVPAVAAGGEGENGAADHTAQGRAAGVNKRGERAGAVSNKGEPATAIYSSNSDVPASVGVVWDRKGAAEKIAVPTLAPQAPEDHRDQKIVVPTPAARAPEHKEHVAAGPRHHGPMAASHPKGATDKMRAPQVTQMARRGEDDYPTAAGEGQHNIHDDHGGEDDRKLRGESWW